MISAQKPEKLHSPKNVATVNLTALFADEGTFHVCEIVSNANGADPFCREVVIQKVATGEPFAADEFQTWPNPATENWNLGFRHPLERSARLSFFDLAGRFVLQKQLTAGAVNEQVNLTGFAAGLYFWRLESNGVRLAAGKVVRLDGY